MTSPWWERASAGIALVVLAPLLFLVAIVVRLTSSGPVFYRATRIGVRGEPFVLIKFRSMRVHESGARVTTTGDHRVTPFGRLLRLTKVDELPQLWNVVRGELRFVGPRPEDPALFDGSDPEIAELASFVPGITSPASIAFRHEEEILAAAIERGQPLDEAYREIARAKASIDLAYLRARSLRSDLGVIASTVAAIVRPRDRDERSSTQQLDSTYRRYRGEYARRWGRDQPGNRAIAEERERVAIELLGAETSVRGHIIDVGAGAGGSMPGRFPSATTIQLDLLHWRLAEASGTIPVCADGRYLPFPDASVDGVLLFTVLSSVPADVQEIILGEVNRVVRDDGFVVAYDFRIPNPRNRATRAVLPSSVTAGLAAFDTSVTVRTLVPQLARLLGDRVDRWYPRLARLPFLRTHFVVVGRRTPRGGR